METNLKALNHLFIFKSTRELLRRNLISGSWEKWTWIALRVPRRRRLHRSSVTELAIISHTAVNVFLSRGLPFSFSLFPPAHNKKTSISNHIPPSGFSYVWYWYHKLGLRSHYWAIKLLDTAHLYVSPPGMNIVVHNGWMKFWVKSFFILVKNNP